MTRGNKSGKKSSKRRYVNKELPSSVVVYLGPIIRPVDRRQHDLHTMQMGYTAALASDGAGKIASVFGTGTVSSANDWASAAALFGEFRVLGMQIDFIPINLNSSLLTAASISVVSDFQAATALGTYGDAARYGSCKNHSINERWYHQVRMDGFENAQFTPTSAVVSTYYIKVISTGNSLSSTMGEIYIHFLVQFKGKGL